MNWWIIVVLVVLVFVFFKFKEFKHKATLVLVILLLLFLVGSFGQLYSTHNLDLSTFEGVVNAGQIYVSWLLNAGGNIIGLGGDAIKQNWDLNITNSSMIKTASSSVKAPAKNLTRR